MSRKPTITDKLLQATPRHEAAVELWLAGKTDADVATALEIHRTTATRWRLEHPAVIALLNRRRQEAYGAHADRLRSLAGKAIDVLARELDAPWDRSAPAAMAILKACRLDAVAVPSGETDCRAVVAKMLEQRVEDMGDEFDRVSFNSHQNGEAEKELARSLQEMDNGPE